MSISFCLRQPVYNVRKGKLTWAPLLSKRLKYAIQTLPPLACTVNDAGRVVSLWQR